MSIISEDAIREVMESQRRHEAQVARKKRIFAELMHSAKTVGVTTAQALAKKVESRQRGEDLAPLHAKKKASERCFRIARAEFEMYPVVGYRVRDRAVYRVHSSGREDPLLGSTPEMLEALASEGALVEVDAFAGEKGAQL